ncbi:MAG: DNA integrity scanning protein DisA nucleotide-binding domain protein [Mycoplasmataceae bacterium]|nr:DNA integrity scanning protein DisA nucleotide-binding domain protein [Mycoplasmataceae bacterium]
MSTINLIYILIGMGAFIILVMIFPIFISLSKLLFRKTNYSQLGQSSKIRLVHQLFDAVTNLSETKTGAIITIINKQQLDDLRTDGVLVDANVSSSLMISLFQKQSPLHDGAIIIQNNKITYAATYYKITSKSIDNKFGARHRAAMGISEQTDSLTIIVSEETGGITFAKYGNFEKIRIEEFQEKLTANLEK